MKDPWIKPSRPMRVYDMGASKRTTLGISCISFNPNGEIEVERHDGARAKVEVPKGWKCQAIGSALVWQCPCGAFVLGAPQHEHEEDYF